MNDNCLYQRAFDHINNHNHNMTSCCMCLGATGPTGPTGPAGPSTIRVGITTQGEP